MLAAIVIVALAAIAGVGVTTVALSRQAERGWLKASEAETRVREVLVARVTTLENRLMSHHWQDFANLQMVPDETAKAQWAAQQRDPESYGIQPEEMEAARMRSDGSDLEGEVFEGPTIG
jgi:hypothetical protein